ncbi:MAG TPA: GNAT family N-acetyltransferase [Candidatus Enterosoma merdigallinarum]|nr:GNAT family N-acetyltransferase [Candidatus Enterosoma merdigallinarum]
MEILTTKRLRMRNFLPEEKEELCRLYNDPDVKNAMHWGKTEDGDVSLLIGKSLGRTPLDSGGYHYAVSFLKSDRLVGEVYLEKKADCFLLGYFIRKERQGKGYAFEILSALLKKLDRDFPDINVEAIVDRENEKSRRLLKKLGFHNDIYQMDNTPYVLYSLYGSIR